MKTCFAERICCGSKSPGTYLDRSMYRQRNNMNVSYSKSLNQPEVVKIVKELVSEILWLRGENFALRQAAASRRNRTKRCFRCGREGHLERACAERESVRRYHENWRTRAGSADATSSDKSNQDEGYGSPLLTSPASEANLLVSKDVMMVSASIAEPSIALQDLCDGESVNNAGGTVGGSADPSEYNATLSVCDDSYDNAVTTNDEEAEEADDEEDEEDEETEDDDEEDDEHSQQDGYIRADYDSDGAFDDADSADEEPKKASSVVAAQPLHSDKTIRLLMKLGEDLDESNGKFAEVFSNVGKLFSSMNSEPTG